MAFDPAPPVFGRGVILGAGGVAPLGWEYAEQVVVDEVVLVDPQAAVERLHAAWVRREPIVVALTVDPASFRQPESLVSEPWRVHPDHEFWLDRLHFLVWANNYDARSGELVWWWATKARRFGAASPSDASRGDASVDGVDVWIDGGPRGNVPFGVGIVVHADSVEQESLSACRQAHAPDGELADDQRGAVVANGVAERVIAPAGSGKTRVLTERLRYLLQGCGYERGNVLAVAYNVRARDELVARTEGIRPRVQTLNGLGFDILATAYGRAPSVIDEREVRRIIDSLLTIRRQRRTNTDPIAPYIEALSTVRLALRDPESVEAERDDVEGFAEMFARYRAALMTRGVVDFDEQIYRSVELLLSDGGLRRHMQSRCRHVLVDEFQDLTPAHVLMLRLLAAPGFDVFGVGDDDQVIYGHAGASPRFLIDFSRLFPHAEERSLGVNYRCAPEVVTAAANLLSWNAVRVAKSIEAGRIAEGEAGVSAVVVSRPERDMVGELRSVVRGWLADGIEPRNIAVLTRVNASLLGPAVGLAETGVPLAGRIGDDLLQRVAIRAALAYLRLAVSPGEWDRDDLVEIYRRPSRGLPDWVTKWFRAPMSLDRLGAVSGRIDDEKVAMKIETLVTDLTVLTRLAKRGGSTLDLLRAVRTQVGLGDAMEQLDRSKNRAGGAGSSQLDDLQALEQVALLHPDAATFEDWLRSMLATPQSDAGVTLATIHRVKGLEWDRVVLFGVSDGLMPHRLADDVEEERRVFHVGLTRCRDRVVILADRENPSPFVDELDTPAPAGHHDRRVIRSSNSSQRTAVSQPASGRVRAATADVAPGSEALLAALKSWRSTVAKASAVPPYVVFHDSVLIEIARLRPTDERSLGRINGVGPAKITKYASDVIALVEAAS